MSKKEKKVFYWSPFTSKVATVFSVINSAEIINKYSLNSGFKAFIIDAVKEWEVYRKDIHSRNIEIINLNKNSIFNTFTKDGFIRSRFAYWYIFFKSFFQLHNLIKNQKPEYLIIHLITSLPLILFSINKYETKLILRISGLPKMTFLRKFIWRIAIKNVFKVTCPTKKTLNYLSKYDFLKDKLIVLKDPVLNISKINEIKKIDDFSDKVHEFINSKFFLSIGRFTRQKNFIFYLKCIIELVKKDDKLKFLIVGEGEQKKELLEIIKINDLSNNVYLLNNTKNVHYLMKKCEAFVLTSLWEDPGVVLIEAAYNNTSIISSNCPNGPEEIVGYDGGYLFNSNSKEDLIKIFSNFINDSERIKFEKKKIIKKRIKEFTCFNHYLHLQRTFLQ